MQHGLYIVDFHAHLKGPGKLDNFCPEEQQTPFFQKTVNLFDSFANFSEPFHDPFLRHMAINHRDFMWRKLYASFGPLGVMEVIRLFKRYEAKNLIASMDRHGIDHSVVCSLEPFITNKDVLDSIEPYPDRISMFASVSKQAEDPVGDMEKQLATGRVSGLKIHPIVGGFACGELYDATKEIVAIANARDLPVLIHTGHIPVDIIKGLSGCSEARYLEPLIAAFPRTRFVLAHIGWEQWRQVLGLAQKYPHVAVETSWQPARIIRRAVDSLGAHRVLFGSDFPLFKQELALAQVRDALTPREFVQVASTNAQRMLKKDLRTRQKALG